MSQEERMVRVENAFTTLVKLAQDHKERTDTRLSRINQIGEAQANSEAKIAALADAQIRTEGTLRDLVAQQAKTEEVLRELASRQIQTEAALTRLALSQAHNDQRLDALIDIVKEGRGSGPQG
jgi:hypothetical protein